MSCWCRILRGHFLLTILYNLLLSGFIFAHFIHCVHPSMVINDSQILPGFCSFPIGLQIILLCRTFIASVLLSFYQLLRYTFSHRASSLMCYLLAVYFSISCFFALWFQIFIWTSELLYEYWKTPLAVLFAFDMLFVIQSLVQLCTDLCWNLVATADRVLEGNEVLEESDDVEMCSIRIVQATEHISVASMNSDDLQCCICLTHFRLIDSTVGEEESPAIVLRLTNCKHYFHSACLDPWTAKSKNCPLCRSSYVCTEPLSHYALLPENEAII